MAHVFQMLTAIPAPLWGLVGVVIGAVMSPFLTARWQRRQWILDNKKSEYREVLDLLNTYRLQLVKHVARYISSGTAAASLDENDRINERRQLDEMQISISNALADRLFVRKALSECDISEQFDKFVQEVWEGRSSPIKVSSDQTDQRFTSLAKVISTMRGIHEQVVEVAENDLGLT